MNLSFKFIKSVSNIYDEMTNNGFSLVYFGEFSHDITMMFTSMAENDMDKRSEEKVIKKKVFHVLVEILQNLNRHSDEMNDAKIGNGLFIIGMKDDIYYIISSNKVNAKHKDSLETALKQVNAASRPELKEMYKKQIKDGKLSDKGGAGLGLIDIARKSGEQLNYQFLQIDENYYFFILEVEINTKKIEKEC
ncbi:MAG: hypothetical protein A2046_13815 [Bacteroidetes bacterium GWA2_30_7]|nr:MAG: hypothetical protein A2046_13815 [Bacteroidetes bacterium GWA2_30_7]